MERRLPVYLLLDCSGSMRGDPIEAVRVGVNALVYALQQDPTAASSAYLSVITFSGEVHVLTPLTPLLSFTTPDFNISSDSPATFLGRALEELEKQVRQEVRKKTQTERGDWLPLVFILTDGKPSDTDTYDTMSKRIKNGEIRELRSHNIIACAAGAKANPDKLRDLTDNVVVLSNTTPQEIAKYFELASMVASSTLGSPGAPRQSVLNTAKNLGINATISL